MPAPPATQLGALGFARQLPDMVSRPTSRARFAFAQSHELGMTEQTIPCDSSTSVEVGRETLALKHTPVRTGHSGQVAGLRSLVHAPPFGDAATLARMGERSPWSSILLHLKAAYMTATECDRRRVRRFPADFLEHSI